MVINYDNVDYDLGDLYELGKALGKDYIPPEYGERYTIAGGRAKNGKKGKILRNRTGALNGWEEVEVDLTSLIPAKDNDKITKSKKYIFGDQVIDPITGDRLYNYFDDVPETFDDLLKREIENVNILPKDKKEEYVRRLKNDLSSMVARREMHDRQNNIGNVLDDLSKYN